MKKIRKIHVKYRRKIFASLFRFRDLIENKDMTKFLVFYSKKRFKDFRIRKKLSVLKHCLLHKNNEAFKFIYKRLTTRLDRDLIDDAAYYDNLEIIQWLHKNTDEGATINAIKFGAMANSTDIIQWLYMNRDEGFDNFTVQLLNDMSYSYSTSYDPYTSHKFEKVKQLIYDLQKLSKKNKYGIYHRIDNKTKKDIELKEKKMNKYFRYNYEEGPMKKI